MPQGRVPDRRKSVVCSLLRVLQRRSKIFHSVLHAKGRRPCQKARKPHLTHCRSIYYICIYQTFPYFCGMKKDFNTGLRKGIEADRVKLTRRRKLLLREMGLAEDIDSTELAEKLHAQTLVVDVLNRNLVRRDEEIEKLKARIAELEGGAKPVAKTSANSSVPPSRNPIGVPHTQSQRKPSGRKTGGQRGASGQHAAAVRGCDRDGALVSRGRKGCRSG